MARFVARFCVRSLEIPSDVTGQNQGQIGRFLPFCRWFWKVPDGTNGARKRTRTSTPLPALAPEASASTNSAIRARGRSGRLGGGDRLVNHQASRPQQSTWKIGATGLPATCGVSVPVRDLRCAPTDRDKMSVAGAVGVAWPDGRGAPGTDRPELSQCDVPVIGPAPT